MHFSQYLVRLSSASGCRLALPLLLTTLLAGCVQESESRNDHIPGLLSEPQTRVVDFQTVACEQIWAFNTDAVLSNPLYWLRTMDCAQRLSPAEARAEAHKWPADNWQSSFKQGVLFSNGNVTPIERRRYLQRLDDYSDEYPATVRPLLSLWREGQGSLLQLSAERSRYATLQQSSDAQLDALRQQQTALSQELAVTRHKLNSLTDIERQLSTRRPVDTDPSHTDKTAPDDESPSATQSEDDATQ